MVSRVHMSLEEVSLPGVLGKSYVAYVELDKDSRNLACMMRKIRCLRDRDLKSLGLLSARQCQHVLRQMRAEHQSPARRSDRVSCLSVLLVFQSVMMFKVASTGHLRPGVHATQMQETASLVHNLLVEVMWGRWFSGDAFGLGHSWCRSRTAADSMVRLDALELLRLGQDLWTRVPTIRDAAGSIDIVASAGLRDLKASRV